MNTICHLILDEERALYALSDTQVIGCTFDGPADGESALKESRNNILRDCHFRLRYPLWHVVGGRMESCDMTETCRAALWYTSDMTIENSVLGGIKALRECDRMTLTECEINSPEFGWLCRDITLQDSRLTAEYAFFGTKGLAVKGLSMKGKYSFQYVENVVIEGSVLDTKDAFWHSKGVTVKNSAVKGEYLGWYSEDLTLIGCHIVGTQPLCYCKNLTLIDCTTEGCDLSFENSSVEATVKGHIHSIKSPASGHITADTIGEIVHEKAPTDGQECVITVSGKMK